MGYVFDGATRRILLTAGTTALEVRDLWSRWVDWQSQGDNAKFLPAFAQTGGEDIDAVAGTQIPIYVFLENAWRIRPQESDHTLNVSDGILLVRGGGDPFLDTVGDFVVRVNYQQPVQAITVASSGGGGGLTPAQDAALIRLLELAEADEELTPTVARKRRRGTSTVLLEKTVTGGNLPGTVTLVQP